MSSRVASGKESDYELQFEEPQLITLGFAYAERGRLSGGAYQSALKKVDQFLDKPLSDSSYNMVQVDVPVIF